MGRVWRACGPDGAVVALKSVPTQESGRRAALRRELAVLSRLQHPGVVQLLDVGEDSAGPWYTMQLLDAPTLTTWMAGNRPAVVALDVSTLATDGARLPAAGPGAPVADARGFLGVLERLARTLAFLHGEGLVHGDLKPSNVMVADGQPILVDFGLAARVGSVEGIAGGSAPWMAPERIEGERIDGRADLYALGAIAYEGLTGTRPFTGADVAAVLHAHLYEHPPRPEGVPSDLCDLLLALLAKDPRDRPGWADEVADEIARHVDSPPVGWPAARRSVLQGPLVGRTAARATVRDTAVGGTAALVLGSAGTGRTVLLAAAARHARRNGSQVFSVHPAGPAPLAGLREMLPTLLDLIGEPAGSDTLVSQWLRAQARPVPTAQALPPGSAGAVRRRLDEWLAAVPAPVLVVADDLDQLDPLSRAWVGALLRRPPPGTSVVAASAEPVEGVPHVEIGPLARGLAGDVLDGMLGTLVPEPMRSVVLDAAAGRPAEIAARVGALLQARALDRVEGEWRWPSDEMLAQVGQGWSAEAQAQLEGPAAAVLDALAILGRATATEVAAVAGVGQAVAEAGLSALLAAGWAEARGASVHMAATLREAVLERQEPAARAALAGVACEVLAQDGRRLVDRATLLDWAGRSHEAGMAWWQAGQDAHALSDLAGAAEAWNRAADRLPEHADFLRVFRITYATLEFGHHEAAERELRAMLDRPLSRFDRQAALGGLGRLLWRTGRTEDAERCFRERLALTDDNPMHRATALADLGSLVHERGDLELALELERAAVAALDGVREEHLGARAQVVRPVHEVVAVNRAVFLGNVGTALLGLRRLTEAMEVLEQATRIADSLPDWQARLLPLRGTFAVALMREGDHSGARPRFQRVLSDAQACGDTLNECVTWLFLARLAFLEGEDPEPWLAPGLAVAESYDYVLQQGSAWGLRAEARLRAGDQQAAARAARIAEERSRAAAGTRFVLSALFIRSQIARATGDVELARRCVQSAEEILDAPRETVLWLAEAGLVARAAGENAASWLAAAESAAAGGAPSDDDRSRLEELRAAVRGG